MEELDAGGKIRMTQPRTFLLSAGGTGGHLFPAEALAQELLARGHRVVVVTDKRGHAFKSLGPDVPVLTVRAATFSGGIVKKLKAMAAILFGTLEASRILFKYKPAVVVGFGGYPSFPAVFAAQCFWFPVVLHEQNAILGKANKVLAVCATAIATSLPGTKGIPARNTAVHTGNPVRPAIIAAGEAPYRMPDGTFKILVTGGSQAASIFSTVIPAAIAQLPAELRACLDVAHQTKQAEVDAVRAVYAGAGVKSEVAPFFGDMAERLKACQLFIGRSGASTVAEIAVAGRPAIFIPYKHVDQQQKLNAEAVTSAGGGWIILQDDFNDEMLAKKLQTLIQQPELLQQAAAAAKACGKADGAARLADLAEKTARG
jgi:UDP-N-acetylglucosamine--N-acetylmuramyl-(pentapeptide) pyrophosphoryl-undecaprenol N-acetylglucosamine transferase